MSRNTPKCVLLPSCLLLPLACSPPSPAAAERWIPRIETHPATPTALALAKEMVKNLQAWADSRNLDPSALPSGRIELQIVGARLPIPRTERRDDTIRLAVRTASCIEFTTLDTELNDARASGYILVRLIHLSTDGSLLELFGGRALDQRWHSATGRFPTSPFLWVLPETPENLAGCAEASELDGMWDRLRTYLEPGFEVYFAPPPAPPRPQSLARRLILETAATLTDSFLAALARRGWIPGSSLPGADSSVIRSDTPRPGSAYSLVSGEGDLWIIRHSGRTGLSHARLTILDPQDGGACAVGEIVATAGPLGVLSTNSDTAGCQLSPGLRCLLEDSR